jgi:hypothetical protein
MGDGSKGENEGENTYLLNISVTMSISCSAAAIFSADDGWGLPSPNIDMIAEYEGDMRRMGIYEDYRGVVVGLESLMMSARSFKILERPLVEIFSIKLSTTSTSFYFLQQLEAEASSHQTKSEYLIFLILAHARSIGIS